MPDPEERFEMGPGDEITPTPKPKKEIDNPEGFLKTLFPPDIFDGWTTTWWKHWQEPVLKATIDISEKSARLIIRYSFETKSFEIVMFWPEQLGDLGSELAEKDARAKIFVIWHGFIFPEDLEKWAPEVKQLVKTIGNTQKFKVSKRAGIIEEHWGVEPKIYQVHSFEGDKFVPPVIAPKNVPGNFNKPEEGTAFWTSSLDAKSTGWLNFCKTEDFHSPNKAALFSTEGARVYTIGDEKDYYELQKKYPLKPSRLNPFDPKSLDFEALSKDYDGIRLASRKLARYILPLRNWDTESTVWLNDVLKLEKIVDIDNWCILAEQNYTMTKQSKKSRSYAPRKKSNISRLSKINLSKRDLIKEAGMFEPPPKMVEDVWNWVLPRYAAIVYENTKDIKLKEAAGKDCGFKTEPYQDFTATIPMDLSGWKYEDEEFKEALKQWKDMFDYVKVNIYSKHEEDIDYVAMYLDKNNQIDIIIYIEWLTPRTVNEYNNIKKSLHRNVEHELIHTGQYIFKHFKNLKEIGGTPSPTMMDETYSPEGRLSFAPDYAKEYNTRDIEFYALLNDEVIRLKQILSKLPADMHMLVFKSAVGMAPPELAGTHFAPSAFFRTLKEREPNKWQKAVKELYKALFKTASLLISKRAAEYVEKKEEESGNITYIYSDKHVKKRNKAKAKKVMKLSKSIKDLKKQVTKDLRDEEIKTPALAVALIIDTYERVGNPQSSAERDTHGVTTWKKKHVSFSNGNAKIKYKGKAGVKQEKEIKPAGLVKELKEVVNGLKPNDEIFPDLTANKVNEYLKKFNITAKDIRGFFANEEMIKALKKLRTTEDEKLRKERFKQALEQTAEMVGHTTGTLKNQYLIPTIETNYIEKNKIQMGGIK
jgi:hypothetical protein